LKGSESKSSKEKKCYCKACKQVYSGHNIEKRENHHCNKGVFDVSTKKDYDLAAMYTCSYEDQPTAIEALALVIVDSNASYSLANSKYIDKLMQSVGVPKKKIPSFYGDKVSGTVKLMGWEKFGQNRKYHAAIKSSSVQMDGVFIANKHITAAVTSNPLPLRNFIQENPSLKMEDVHPIFKPSLILLTPDVSDARSFIGVDVELQELFLENGHRLKLLITDALTVQVFSLLFFFFFFISLIRLSLLLRHVTD
jgi:hypothetical protein